jgi:hypothetical protein
MIIPIAFRGIGSDEITVIRRHQNAAPVNVVSIANEFGVTVWEDRLDGGISGKLFKDRVNGGPTGYSIIVNAPESLVRKRFTVAHEIAHFLLHRNQASEINDDVYYRSGLSSAMEMQANQVAAEILMPRDLINQLIQSGARDLASLARALQVSIPAMQIRLGIPIT